MCILTRFSVYWAQPWGCLFLTFLLGIHWGSVRFSPKMVAWAESLQVPSENKILMIIIIFFWAAWERETLSILSEYPHRSLQHTHTHFCICFVSSSWKNGALPLLFYFKELVCLNHSSPARKKDERLEHELPWDFKKCLTPAEDGERKTEWGRRGGRIPWVPCDDFHANH